MAKVWDGRVSSPEPGLLAAKQTQSGAVRPSTDSNLDMSKYFTSTRAFTAAGVWRIVVALRSNVTNISTGSSYCCPS